LNPLGAATAARRARIRIGDIWIDRLTLGEALDSIEGLVDARRGGVVFTPNTDHLVTAEDDAELREAYAGADLALVDGMPVVWASRLLGTPLPERVSGADLTPVLLERAARRGLRVYLFGAKPGVAEKAAERLRGDGVVVAGTASPFVGLTAQPDEDEIVAQVRAARPDLVLVALGSPKQERFIHRRARQLAPAVCIGVGATLDFLAGTVRRAPRWMSRAGLEWLFRLVQEPRRLARRYLWNDPRFALIVWRTLQAPRETRWLFDEGGTQ
jgi:N-acetylglucosaminyldiphosphoundecaprenol N-acetyl-beta-D-mannosaminyltransferase